MVRPVPRAHKASKDPSVLRALSGSGDQLALRDRPVRRAPLARPAPQDRQARRATPGRLRQFAWSPVPTAFAAEMTKSWLVSFARAARPRERNARRLARQQPVYVYGGDLVGAVRSSSTFSKACADGSSLSPAGLMSYGQFYRVRIAAPPHLISRQSTGLRPRRRCRKSGRDQQECGCGLRRLRRDIYANHSPFAECFIWT